MIDTILKFKNFVPLFQNLLWIIFIGVIIFIFRKMIRDLVLSLTDRIKKGSSLKIGNIELGALDYVEQTEIKATSNSEEREKHRTNIYKKNRGLFLTHILAISKRKKYKYDIFIYLIRHNPEDYNEKYFFDISYVEFFFGHMWGNEIFKVEEKNGIIGISTSAYAPFLCTCLIKMKDGTEIELYRYIDFESGN
jgi:hypothetical protein